jgi:hypothetical protein
MQQTPLLAGDVIDVAFTIGHNDHPEFGGLELSLRDFKAETSGSSSSMPAGKTTGTQAGS